MTKKITFKELGKVQSLIEDGLGTGGAHHKQWYLEQIAKELGIELNEEEYEPGVAP